MSLKPQQYTLIEKQPQIDSFYRENKDINWLCFDTEFVGEKRFYTKVCLIQVATIHGNYLIDPLAVTDLSVFLDMVVDPNILKITHAGDNDYRLLNIDYGIVPKNVFDTQVAAGLVGYRYPVAFRKLVEGELNIRLDKGYAVTDWEMRPFQAKQLRYALNDVIPLAQLKLNLEEKLKERNRLHWARQEFALLEEASFYEKNPHQEALNSNLMRSLNRKERIFLIRLFEWRREMAEKRDHSKEMVLQGKYISHIVRGVTSGRDALKQNRRVPDKINTQYGEIFQDLWLKEPTEEEIALLDLIPREGFETPQEEVIIDMVYLLIKYKCMENEVSPSMVLPRNMLKKLREDPTLINDLNKMPWKREFLGDTIFSWMENLDNLKMEINGGNIELRIDHG
ncbi:MAG: ribonuclease D [Saprospiraceae bacterium]|nr:MAG: ribonuclease D [Saprospiraceae bacterium]